MATLSCNLSLVLSKLATAGLNDLVNVPNFSGLIQVNASTVVAGLVGFFWPRFERPKRT